MKGLVVFTAFALLFVQGSESSFIDSIKKDMEEVRDELLSRVLVGHSELTQVMTEVKTKKPALDLDACYGLTKQLISAEDLTAKAVEIGIDIVENFTKGTDELMQCLQVDLIRAVKCAFDKVHNLQELVSDTKHSCDQYDNDWKASAKGIKGEFWQCFKPTAPPPTTTAAPKRHPTKKHVKPNQKHA